LYPSGDWIATCHTSLSRLVEKWDQYNVTLYLKHRAR